MTKNLIIGLDVGGTKIHAGLVTAHGKVIKRARVMTQASAGRAAVLKNIEAAVREVWHKDVAAIGVGMAGAVDHARGAYLQGPNFPRSFRNVAIVRHLKSRFRVPVVADNDAHCFALGEAHFGAGKGLDSVVGLTLGTGIGGGIVMNGRLYRGRNNAAGELGHMVMDEQLPKTQRRKRNDFEDFVSGTAMARMYAEKTGKRVDALTVEKLALKGDAAAKAVVATMRRYFVAGVANLVHILNPDIIVVGGGISRLKALWAPTKKDLGKRVIFPFLATTPVVKAKLGEDAQILGAALLTGRLDR